MASDRLFPWGKENHSCHFSADLGFHLEAEALCSREYRAGFLPHCIFKHLEKTISLEEKTVIISSKKEGSRNEYQHVLQEPGSVFPLLCVTEKKMPQVAPKSL